MTRLEYRDRLRAYIKDHEFLNRLLKFEEENTDDELDMYLEMAWSFLASMPPLVGIPPFDSEDFLFQSLIIHQATIEALISNSIVAARNDLTYNNGGITVKIDDGTRYLNMLQNLYRMADREIGYFLKWKVALNIEDGFGGVNSPYAYIRGYGSRRNYLY